MKIAFLFCVLFVAVCAKEKSSAYDFFSKLFESEYRNYKETGLKSVALDTMLKSMKAPTELRKMSVLKLSESKQTTTCMLCRSAVTTLLSYRKDGHDDEYMRNIAVDLCVGMKIQPEVVCEGLIDGMLKVILYIVDNTENLTAKSICGTVLQGSDCVNDEPEFDWSVEVSPPKERISAAKSNIPARSENDLTIVHISDIHYDPHYKIGSLANCEEPMCCRRTDVELKDASEGAGFWGDYRDCDAPLHAIENAFDQIMKEHKKIDFIYYTGDYVDHAVWSTSVEGNKETIRKVDMLMKDKFGDIPVYPIIGNHEPDPLNVFAPEYIKETGLETGWLYDFLADDWSIWLPLSAQETIRKGGYYTHSPRPGFRIIALNNNDSFTFNFWLLFDPSYLKKQLQWLQDTLLQAELDGESVHILAHIPSGDGECYTTWAREFRRIVDRYHNTINGIFNGHTHADHFSVYYSKTEPSYPVNVAWNGGSVTPFSFVNPNYRIYGVDPETYQVVHHETWMMNLTLANLMPERTPGWYKEYTFANAYGVKDLSPATLDKLVEKFATDRTLLTKYWAFNVKLGDPSLKMGCNLDCLKGHLCNMATTQSNDKERCDSLLSIFSAKYDSDVEY